MQSIKKMSFIFLCLLLAVSPLHLSGCSKTNDVHVWSTYNTRKVMQSFGSYEDLGVKLDVLMAKGETEGAQLLITPEKDVKSAVLTSADLTDAEGNVYEKIYRSGAYITLEEVAAYIYAFQELPPNYDADKNASPRTSMWGEYLRVNHSHFKGDTSRYPYEPELPHIDGCPGGYLTYYELDIGTTASGYSGLYNDGSRISRGAARIVYARYEEDGSLVHSSESHYLFYTYNHYNDFEEYLNYFGGWGVRFGKVTAGGEEDSSFGPEPTPYVDVVEKALA